MSVYDDRLHRLEQQRGDAKFVRELDAFRFEATWPADPSRCAALIDWFGCLAEFRAQGGQADADGARARLRLVELASDHDPGRAERARDAILDVVGADAASRGESGRPHYGPGDAIAMELAPCSS